MLHSIKKKFSKILEDWHPTLNGKMSPVRLSRTTRKKYWWKCHKPRCGCNWKASIRARIKLGNDCPKCAERKRKKFNQDLLEIKKIFKKTRQLQLQIDKYLDVFIDDNSSKTRKLNVSIIIRKKIDEINRLGLKFRKIILNYKKKMIIYNIEKQLKENE